ESGEKAWSEGKEAVAKCKEALDLASKHDWDGAKKAAEESKAKLEQANQDAEDCNENAKAAYEMLPEQVKRALEQLVEKLKSLMGNGESTLGKTLAALEQKAEGGLEDAREELKRLGEDFKAAAETGADMLAHLATGTDAVAGSADQSVGAAKEVQDNPVRKADERSKAAEAQHDALVRGHDENKD